jgi:tripartite ATP-independent transporter DctP family solute receptor
MKHFFIASILTMVGLVVFILVDTNQIFNYNKVTVDEEQQGLEEQIVIRFSHVVAENTPKGLAAQKFAELVYEKTDGLVKVEVFPNGILYSDEEELKAIKRGDIQMIAPSYTTMSDIVPTWKVLDLPFIFRDYDHAKAVLTGDISQTLLNDLQEKEMKGLAFWSNGFKQMTHSDTTLVEPADFKGVSFRIMPSGVLEKQFRLLGAEPVMTSFTEVYHSLENHEVDGLENTISNIYTKGLYKFQPYLTLSNHGYLGYAVIVNDRFWNALPDDIQQEIEEAMEETTLWNMEKSIEMNEKQLQELKNKGTITIDQLPDESKERWKKRFQPLYDEVENEVGKKLIDQIKDS